MIMQIHPAVTRQQTPRDEPKHQAVPRDLGGGRVAHGKGTAGTGLPLVDEQEVGDEECRGVA
jgi:hypothetical protein